MATRQLSGDTTVNDLGHISRSLDCFTSKFLKNSVWYGKSYYRQLLGNHTLAFNWCHFWWSWSTFEGHSPRLSFPRPFQLSLACFRVARSPSNSWASCYFCARSEGAVGTLTVRCFSASRASAAASSSCSTCKTIPNTLFSSPIFTTQVCRRPVLNQWFSVQHSSRKRVKQSKKRNKSRFLDS